jgi:hypothetical protein
LGNPAGARATPCHWRARSASAIRRPIKLGRADRFAMSLEKTHGHPRAGPLPAHQITNPGLRFKCRHELRCVLLWDRVSNASLPWSPWKFSSVVEQGILTKVNESCHRSIQDTCISQRWCMEHSERLPPTKAGLSAQEIALQAAVTAAGMESIHMISNRHKTERPTNG